SRMASGSGSSRGEGQYSPAGAVAVSPRSRSHLLFGVLFSSVSDQGSYGPAGNPAGAGLSHRRGRAGRRLKTILGRPYASMVVFRRSCPDVSLLAGRGGVAGGDILSLAAHRPGPLFCLLPVLRGSSAGVFGIPIGRHAARSRVHLHLLCAARSAARAGCPTCALAPEPVLVALGMVPHLLRIRRGQNCQRRL